MPNELELQSQVRFSLQCSEAVISVLPFLSTQTKHSVLCTAQCLAKSSLLSESIQMLSVKCVSKGFSHLILLFASKLLIYRTVTETKTYSHKSFTI